jgi:hypothetical protein
VIAFETFTPSTTGILETSSYPASGREVEKTSDSGIFSIPELWISNIRTHELAKDARVKIKGWSFCLVLYRVAGAENRTRQRTDDASACS